jgi:hypothetical protein
MTALFDFLQKNQIEKGNLLPAVHSTEAYFIKKFSIAPARAALRGAMEGEDIGV